MSLSDRRTVAAIVFAVLVFGFVDFRPAGAQSYDEPNYLSDEEIASIVVKFFPAREVAKVLRVIDCESSNNAHAVSEGWSDYYGRYQYFGLLQVSTDLHQWIANRLIGRWVDLRDAVANIATGADIWASRYWNAWPVCGLR